MYTGTHSRRVFLQSSAVLASSFALSRAAFGASANERLGVAFIGLGGMGSGHRDWFAQQPDVQVVGLCDVDASHLKAAQAKSPGDCFATSDFRELVGRDDVDAVVVATPDHWHALTAIAAAKAGKHIYCEKPLCNSIAEGRALANAVSAAGVTLQTGSHERSNPGARIAQELIAAGKLGKIHTVRIQLPNADEHLQEVANFTSPPPDSEPPAGLDYDRWLGPAPSRAYNPKRCHFWWRFHSAYGGGEITDRGCHVIDLAHMILGLDDTGPVEIRAHGEHPQGNFYDAFINFQFENRYANGLRMIGTNSGERGVQFEGDQGKLFVKVHGADLVAEPASLLDGVTVAPAGHHATHRRNFVDAVFGKAKVVAPVEAGHRTATVCHLNNIAMRLGQSFTWDPQTETASLAEANAMLGPKMREPWKI
jgi:predicted dehydrogenase